MYSALKKLVYHTSAFLFAAATIVAFIQVICRYVLNSSLSWAEESIRYMFIWMFFLGAAEATRTGTHIALDVIFTKMDDAKKRIAASAVDIVVIIFLGILGYYGYKLSIMNMTQKSPALQIPLGYISLAIPVGSVMMIIFYFYNIFNRFSKKGKEGCKC